MSPNKIGKRKKAKVVKNFVAHALFNVSTVEICKKAVFLQQIFVLNSVKVCKKRSTRSFHIIKQTKTFGGIVKLSNFGALKNCLLKNKSKDIWDKIATKNQNCNEYEI